MEELIQRALKSADIANATVSLKEAVLVRASHHITMTLESDVSLEADQIEALRRVFSEALPGFSLSLNIREPEEELPQPMQFSIGAVAPTPAAAVSSLQINSVSSAASTDQQVLMGKSIKSGKITPISQLRESENSFVIEGTLVSFEPVETFAPKNGGKQVFRVQLNVTDQTDSIHCSCSFYAEDKREKFLETMGEALKSKAILTIKGAAKVNRFGKGELNLYVNDLMMRPGVQRQDTAEDKRVELHLHTRMSTMDALTDVKAAFKTAKRFGHKALAITDHGVVQAFPDAAKASKDTGVKAIFGVEGYLLSDAELISLDQTYVVFDIETTGLKAASCEIIELGAIKVRGGEVIDRFSTFVDNGGVIPPEITKLTRITNEMIAGAPNTRSVLTDFSKFIQGCVPVAHNAKFDMGFVREHGQRYGLDFSMPFADTLMLARYLIPGLPNYKLDTVCDHYNVDISGHHRAIDDATATAQVFLELLKLMQKQGIDTIPVLAEKKEEAGDGKKSRVKTNHIIILARTQAGLKNLYRLVSAAHLDHFRSRPIIPRSLLSIHRQGLILGSACEQGELYQAVFHGASDEELERIAKGYDFLEIQPRGNNAFMVREGMVPDEEAILEHNRKIVALGDRLNIPVAATGDVHFLEPEDQIYRQILMMKLGFSDAQHQPPLYFKTTDEMLEEFSYLGADVAHRVVVETPNAIADQCEELKPFPDGTHAPKIEDAESILTNMAEDKAREIYGDPLPEVVRARLDKELKSIIGNGFASLYLMAERLVKKSNSDGYLVGSRGSVGSSFVATMAGITEVNPLQPHYVCPKCRHSEFDVDRTQYACGVDMPDAFCPNCGTKYKKEGFDIPFEVFLGFKGDKTPDIDLNFSGEYQPVAHKYVEEMFGTGHAFRAGTISGLAERKAFECVENYAQQTGRVLRRSEQERLAKGCLNVKVTTGQHPGGIVIVPKDEDILDFSPIQYPADKKDKNTITTHFDFHAMDDRLVKLDILGHDDPTALRMLEDLTGLNPREIPLDDPETRGIFSSVDPLKIHLDEMECTVGSIGVPEFGTDFVRGVLQGTRPKQMEELVRIAGLTHGTDVWLNNAEPLVMNGIAKLSDVLCTRDDIMNYLIAHGMEASLSFKIMERVRKGKGLTEEMEQALIDGKIPEWFIDSCHKIKYMFPRGHAVAYTMMAFRIAYYKVHHPLEFYAVYFTVRADAFDITQSLGGAEKVFSTIQQINKAMAGKDFAEKKRDKELITILEVVFEMNKRGIPLLPVDIYHSQGTKFIVENGGIRPPFTSLPGVGANAANGLVFQQGERPYISIEDFQKRTGANSGIVALLEKCGCLNNLPRSNQISLF